MRPSRLPRLEAIGLAIAIELLAAGAMAQVPNAAPVANLGSEQLQLEVVINNTPTDLIAAVTLSPNGELSIQPDELRSLGLIAPAGMSGAINLTRLTGVKARYDQINQRLFLIADDRALEPHRIAVRPRPMAAVLSKPTFGAVLNYQLFGQSSEALTREGTSLIRVSSDVDARIFGPLGVLDTSLTVEAGAGRRNELIRTGTLWTWSRPGAMVTARAGDLITGGFDWTRPIRMAGLQFRRDFSLRPDLITMPGPTLSGSAAVASTLEVFTNKQPVYVNALSPGPFQLNSLPIVDGFSETRMVLRDANGIERTITAHFYATPDLVRAGLLDFSTEIGFAERDFASSKASFDSSPVGSLSVRYGLNDYLTVQGHGEGGSGVVEGGGGVVARLASLGVVDVALAGSEDRDQLGGQIRVGFQGQYRGLFFGGSRQQTFGGYSDIASATTTRILVNNVWSTTGAAPKELTQLSVSAPLGFARFGQASPPAISMTYAARTDGYGRRDQTITLGARHTLSRFTVYATAYETLSGGSKLGFFVGMSMPLSNRTSVSAGVESSDTGPSAFVEASHQAQAEPGSAGWYMHVEGGAQDELSGSANYLSRFGRLQGDLEVRPQQVESQVSFAGSMVFMDGAVFAAPLVQNAFAVVDVGQPGVAVRFQNRFIGVTNAQGRLLAPDLNPYEANALDIDPSNLPVETEIESTHAIATPTYGSGVLVKFNLKTAELSALVTLKNTDGQVVAAGSQASLTPDGEAFIIGYDGQVFVKNLNIDNHLYVTRLDGTTCVASFSYHLDTQDTIHVLDAICR